MTLRHGLGIEPPDPGLPSWVRPGVVLIIRIAAMRSCEYSPSLSGTTVWLEALGQGPVTLFLRWSVMQVERFALLEGYAMDALRPL